MNKDKQKVADLFAAVSEKEPSLQAEFLNSECGNDSALRAEVEKLLKTFRNSRVKDFLSVPALEFAAGDPVEEFETDKTDPRIGETVGHYKIVERIGAGGMGTIYLAERASEEIRQRVAVKIIKRGMDTEQILKRFRHERQILANLEHPFIARFLDAGTTADGLPFFVMELVRGLPIDEYCRTNKLNEKERLKLFRKVCQAVSFAHQKLVVHRDLKPSNILVNESSEPKLLDFGIAKLLDADDEATQTNLRLLTPAYASPEQQRGEIVGTTSDVYSLGVILAEILGVQSSKVKARSSKIEAETIVQKSNLKDQSLNRDLQHILAKALREEAARRYQSVEQFSEDIRRYLSGLPITARKDFLSYRAKKFVRRNRTASAVTFLFFLSLLGGLIATFWQYRKAQIAQARAERRFNEVRQLSNYFLFELNDEIEKSPTGARSQMVKKALQYLDNLAPEASDDTSLQREIALAYIKVGDLQGRAYVPNLGDADGALENYRKAAELIENLIAANPSNTDLLITLSDVRQRFGEIAILQGKRDEAVKNQSAAAEIRQKLLASDPQNKDFQRAAAESYMRVGDALQVSSDGEERNFEPIIEYYKKSLAVYENLAAESSECCSPDDYSIARLHQRLGVALMETGTQRNNVQYYQTATEHYRRVVEIISRFLAKEPSNLKYKAIYAGALASLAGAQETTDLPAAAATFSRVIAAVKSNIAADPAEIENRFNLAEINTEYARVLDKTGKSSQAETLFIQAIQILEKLAVENPSRISDFQPQLRLAHFNLGTIYERQKNFSDATAEYRLALDYSNKLLTKNPKDKYLLGQHLLTFLRLSKSYRSLSKHTKSVDDSNNARNFCERGLEVRQNLKNQNLMPREDSAQFSEIEETARQCSINSTVTAKQ